MHRKIIKYLATMSLAAALFGMLNLYNRSLFTKRQYTAIGETDRGKLTFSDVPVKVERKEKYNWNYTGLLHKKYKQFAPGLNETEYKWYLELISVFKTQCETFNITYMLAFGSALGAYRYHGFVPWDDDIDVQVNSSQKQNLTKALSSVPGHVLQTRENDIWKFFSSDKSVTTPYKWSWPFIDILFLAQNGTHTFDVTMKSPRKYDPISDVLPLGTEIFENMVLPVPGNLEAYLSRKYNMHEPCLSNGWDHKHESSPRLPAIRIPCKMLFGVYSVVHRFHGNDEYAELRLGNKTLYRTHQRVLSLI